MPTMHEHLKKIRLHLSELERVVCDGELPQGDRDFSALELPIIIQEIVDDLQPLLTPYEIAFYWYAFRHSIGANGDPHVRLSGKAMRSGCVKSSYSQAVENRISEGKVRDVFRALEEIGAIRKEGEPNRDGTLYRVLIPEEIEACRELRRKRDADVQKPEVTPSEVDHYNVRENRLKIYERDGYKCRYCQKQLTQFTATLDHVVAVSEGGDNSIENLLTACLECNSRKHKRPVGDFLSQIDMA